VLVRDDVALVVDDEAAPGRAARSLVAERIDPRAGRRLNLDDAVLDTFVEGGGGRGRPGDGLRGRSRSERSGIAACLQRDAGSDRAADAGSDEERRCDGCQLLAHGRHGTPRA
jgi:hypothetical protein